MNPIIQTFDALVLVSNKFFLGGQNCSCWPGLCEIHSNFLVVAKDNGKGKRRDNADVLEFANYSLDFNLKKCRSADEYIFRMIHHTEKNMNFTFQLSNEEELLSSVSMIHACSRKADLTGFRPISSIGRGKYGKVIAAERTSVKGRQLYAIKEVECNSQTSCKHIQAESLVLRLLSHNPSPFLVSTTHAMKLGGHLYYVMELMRAGDLYTLLCKFDISLSSARFYAAEILSALENLHNLNILYRDLKPENILVDDTGHIKLTDFGLSKYLPNGEVTKTCCGTESYTPPEMFGKTGYSFCADFWQFGCILFELHVGKSPFYFPNISMPELKNKILNAAFEFPANCSSRWKSIVSMLLVPNPSDRIGVAENIGWSAVRKHPFFKSLDWDSIANRSMIAPVSEFNLEDDFISNFEEDFTSEDPNFCFNLSECTLFEKELQGFDFRPYYELQTLADEFMLECCGEEKSISQSHTVDSEV